MKFDSEVTLQDVKLQLARFRDQRDWRKFHDPKNLAEAISIEASELLELFLWKTPTEIDESMRTDPDYRKDIERELADVFCFTFNMAVALNLDVSSIVRQKMQENARKYPVGKSKSKATKYTGL
jgi:NTP pyrophosphatase (non-canonical NTP hydrolase)